MVTVVKCPICKNNRKVKDRQRFFVCCKVTHIVADNFICKGVDRAGKAGKTKEDGTNSANPQEPIGQQEPKPENNNQNPGQQVDNRDRAVSKIEPELPDYDECCYCHTRFKSFGGNIPEKCPVCGGKWR